MTQRIEILADNSLSAQVAGNLLVLETELVPGNSVNDAPEVAFSLVVNDGQPEVPAQSADGETIAATPNTEMYFRMTLLQAQQLSSNVQDLVRTSEAQRTELLVKALEFKSAQLSCAKGAIGALEIVKVADSDRGNVIGFGFYDLIYSDDSGDLEVLHHVKNIECYVPFMEEEQMEWLRALVGGNHQFTSSIKITLTGFDLAEVRETFLSKFAEQHVH